MSGRAAYLVGTRHDFHGLGPGWKQETVEQFLGFVATLAQAEHVDMIGEEASAESVECFAREEFGGVSAVEQRCRQESLEYLAFDLTDAECIEAGLPASHDARGALEEGRVEKAKELTASRFSGRERAWIQRIESELATRLLLVMGANHIESFSKKLAERGWDVVVIEANWRPPESAART